MSSNLVERITKSSLSLRAERVLLDEHLAARYGAETRARVQAVKRNLERFPADFMAQLDSAEWASLKAQTVISSPKGWGGRRFASPVPRKRPIGFRKGE